MADPGAVDHFLGTLLASQEFVQLPGKDWALLAALVPGSTARQLESRYHELGQERRALKEAQRASHPPKTQPPTAQEEDRTEESAPRALKSKDEPHPPAKGGGGGGKKGLSQNSNMVIHVCDEAKSLKQDFHCPRNLLINEMKYFAEYLSVEVNRYEDVDISVHCDVQIFDWLMRYVKRDATNPPPKLEPGNAISILISSDFLKMEALVAECVDYCAANLEEVVATPCNMNCISDRLLTLLCNKFDHSQVENLKDRKDKIRSKLFAKKVEQMFDPRAERSDSMYSAHSLYRCLHCTKLLVQPVQSRVPCVPSKVSVSARGSVVYRHARDTAWDVNEYVINMHKDLKSWRGVYWALWGLLNVLKCTKCRTTFQARDLGSCLFHPSKIAHDPANPMEGVLSCCGRKQPLFSPLQLPTGCSSRDHTVDTGARDPHLASLLADTLRLRGDVCATHSGGRRPRPDSPNACHSAAVFANEAVALLASSRGEPAATVFERYSAAAAGSQFASSTEPPPLESDSENDDAADTPRTSDSDDDEDSGRGDGGRAPVKNAARTPVKTQQQPKKKGNAVISVTSRGGPRVSRKWDQARSLRWNQDVQRNEDLRRFNEMTLQLMKSRVAGAPDKKDLAPPAGGIYARLEHQFRQSQAAKGTTAKPAATGGGRGAGGFGSGRPAITGRPY